MTKRCARTTAHGLIAMAMGGALALLPIGALAIDAEEATPSPLLAVDQNRRTVIDRIVRDWGATLEQSNAGTSRAQLRSMLEGLRADHLLTASLAGSLDGLRQLLAAAAAQEAAKPALLSTKALGDANQDLVYTPVAPCRLFDTRPAQGGQGTPSLNVRRTYGATAPVTNQGGPGGCAAGAGATVALIQIGALTPSGSGLLQAGPQGATSFPNALILYQAGDQYGTAVTMPLNPANGQFDLVEQFATADLYGDLLGYFKAPDVNFFRQGGNAFGATAVLGTTDNAPVDILANGTRAMRFQYFGGAAPNVIGGHFSNGTLNTVVGATIGGGGGAPGATVDGYTCFNICYNFVLDNYGTIGGGAANQAGDGNISLSDAHFATVGGGNNNTASAGFSTIAGGYYGIASAFSSTVSGGQVNTASGFASTVAGGSGNTASGTSATVVGGDSNTAAGNVSFAAGYHAFADNNGCFVWADYSGAGELHCDHPNQVVMRGMGGFLFVTGGSNPNYSGAWLQTGSGAWITFSDRDGKENIEPADPRAVLEKLVRMPVSTWNWKAQDRGIRHLGPMAQDFRAAFGLGESPRGISTVDADGVALAAIQGLHQLVQEKDARLDAQAAEIAELRRAVEVLLARTSPLGKLAVAP